MADDADRAADLQQMHIDNLIRAARVDVPVGYPGECADCGEDVLRLVGGRCARCRDGRR